MGCVSCLKLWLNMEEVYCHALLHSKHMCLNSKLLKHAKYVATYIRTYVQTYIAIMWILHGVSYMHTVLHYLYSYMCM